MNIEKAYILVKETGLKYSPKRDLCYLIQYDKENDCDHEYGDDSYCEDCIDAVVKETDEADIGYRAQGSPETDDFILCEKCGEIIHSSILFTFDQELAHWMSLPEGEIKSGLNDPRCCYTLMKIFESSSESLVRYPEMTNKLAEKVIKEYKEGM